MDRTLFSEEHDLFRQAVKQYVDREVRPNQATWRKDGIVSREAWRKGNRVLRPVPSPRNS